MLTNEFKRKPLEKLENCTAEQMVSTLEKIGSVKMTKEKQWITKAVSLLKQMEYAATDVDYGDSDDNWDEPWITDKVCPICGAKNYHEESCELNELIYEGLRITEDNIGIAKRVCEEMGVPLNPNGTQPTVNGNPIDFNNLFEAEEII